MKYVLFFITNFILWLLLTWTINAQHLLIGLALSFITTLLFGSLFINDWEREGSHELLGLKLSFSTVARILQTSKLAS